MSEGFTDVEVELPARSNDVYDHNRVELLTSAIAKEATDLDCNLLEIESATRSLHAVVAAQLKLELGDALPECVEKRSKRSKKKSAAKLRVKR